jgi:parallel beta-helix repeat protein
MATKLLILFKKNTTFFLVLLLCLLISPLSVPAHADPINSHVTQINVLDAYGEGRDYDSAAIIAAIKDVRQDEKALLVLKPGVWVVVGKLVIPANICLKIEEGAVLSVDSGNSVVIEGSIEAGKYQIFSGVGNTAFRNDRQEVFPNWWKDRHSEYYDYAVQRALSSGALSVFFPEGTYEVAIKKEYTKKSIEIPSNIRIHGIPGKSIIELGDTPRTEGVWTGNDLFTGTSIENVEISGITFDAEKFYPDAETTSRLDPSIRGTRAINISHANNTKIVDCRFQGFTNGSVLINGNNITIDKNSFYHGSYRTQTVRLDGSKHVMVSNNTFEDNGPHYYTVLGRPLETASTDALMVGYHVEDASIINNKIKSSSGCGIRVEMSNNVSVSGNIIQDVGQDGITFYFKDRDCKCIGNIISNWGKLNNFGYLRRQNGKIYNPKEYHYPPPASPQLPKKLENAATWELNRYYLQRRDESSIPEYDPADYKKVLAFRGFSGISVTELSQDITIDGNKITGNTSKTGGLFNYASNYGINIGVHNVNPPTSSGNCIISNNTISDCIDYDLYCPQYVDPTSKRGVAMPSKVFGNIYNSSKVLFYYQKN